MLMSRGFPPGAVADRADVSAPASTLAPMDDAASRRRARAGLRSAAARAGARSHFRAMGIDPDRLDGPIVGIASTWTQTMPCNLNHRRLAERAAAAVEEAGGGALALNTIAGSHNPSQATPRQRAAPGSRGG